MSKKEKKDISSVITISSREDIEQFAEYLKTFIDKGLTLSFSETFSQTKIWDTDKGLQRVGLWTVIEEERVDKVCEYIVLSLALKNENEKNDNPIFLENLNSHLES